MACREATCGSKVRRQGVASKMRCSKVWQLSMVKPGACALHATNTTQRTGAVVQGTGAACLRPPHDSIY